MANMAGSIFAVVWVLITLLAVLGVIGRAICDRLEDIARAIRDEKERKPHG